jgi:iron complex transport system substrate-binding protein
MYCYKPQELTEIESVLFENLTRRRFLTGMGGLLGAAALGACGAGEQASAPAATVAATRRVTHAGGETDVPVNPQRIVAVDYNTVEELLVLGITPAGVLYTTPSFLRDATAGVPVIGNDGTPNLERIASLAPDLIIAWEPQMGEGNYEPLSQIAPTVLIERDLDGTFAKWREELLVTAEIVGRTAQAQEQLAAFDQRATRIGAALAERGLDRQEISVFGSFNAEFAVFNYLEGFCITVLNQLGLQVAQAQIDAYAANPDVFNSISLELLPQLDADFIFFLNAALDDTGGDAEFINNAVKNNPLFQQLSAVQNGRLCEVPYARYNQGSIIAANLILDDVERCLLGGQM